MAQKISLILLAVSLSSAFSFGEVGCAHPSARDNESTTRESTGLAETSNQEFDRHIRMLVSSLSSADDKVRLEAQGELIRLKDSPAKRRIAIKELLDSIGRNQELDGNHPILTSTVFEFWRSATDVLAGLQAEEAIDLMIRCINCSNGLSGIEGEPPASYALYEMGQLGVPKLSYALLHEPDAYKRFKIVLCLSRIGGSEANAALKRALEVETDKELRKDLKHALSQAPPIKSQGQY